jgi:hypothetical protein
VETLVSASSIVEMSDSEPPLASAALADAVSDSAVSSARPPEPIAPLSVTAEVVIVSPSLAPTWKVNVLPVSSWLPLNDVLFEMSLSSWPICDTSAAIASWSLASSVPLLNCTFRSRTRWIIDWTSSSEPSAV